MPLAVISVLQYFFGTLLFILSTFLVLLVLVQRGRGGGLTGALGGPGGQSAFGTKAGDVFTRITIVLAGIWIFLNALAVWSLQEKDFTTSGGLPPNIVSPVGNKEGSTIPTGMTGSSDLGFGDLKSDPAAAPTTLPGSATPEVTSETFPKDGAEAPPAAGTPAAGAPAAGTPAAGTEPGTPAATPAAAEPATGTEPGASGAAPTAPTEGDTPK